MFIIHCNFIIYSTSIRMNISSSSATLFEIFLLLTNKECLIFEAESIIQIYNMGEDETVELLKIEGLSKTIKKKKILNNISLTVNSGEIVGFLGPNGAGKTTTIKLILGLLKIAEGKITICGHDVSTDFENAMEHVGGIVENPDLYKRMTGRQNLEYFASMYRDVDRNHIDEVVKMVKMSERIDDRVKTYSLGMCQRIGIAQAMLHRQRLMVLD